MSASNSEIPTADRGDTPTVGQETPARTMEQIWTQTDAKTMTELLTKILAFLIPGSDAENKSSVLSYRLVNRQWKTILDSLIEEKIVAGEFPAIPEMNLEDNFRVSISPSRFRAGRNAFPFNALHLNGTGAMLLRRLFLNHPEPSHFPMLRLPAFTSRFGGDLTTLALCDELQVPINTMAMMLSTMTNLKRLCLHEVMEANSIAMREELVFRSAPPLPSLTFLDLALRIEVSPMDDKINMLYVWLIASSADQLERLHLELEHPFPPLKARHGYTYPVSSGATRPIATTSGSAFGNLKELKISHPTRKFLVCSETPVLQCFSIVDTHLGPNDFELKDVAVFIDKCSSTLEKLVLFNEWKRDALTSEEAAQTLLDGNRPLLPASQAVFPKLKTFMIRYPLSDLHEMVLHEFVVKFQALEVLHLLHFYLHDFDSVMCGHQDNYQSNEAGENAEDIAALKQQLALRFKQLSRISNSVLVAKSNLARLGLHPEGGVEDQEDADAQRRQLETEIEGLKRDMTAVQKERLGIYNRLNALGEYSKELMVEQLVEREGFWNSCPKLRILSVSYSEEPDGSLLVARRPEPGMTPTYRLRIHHHHRR